MATEHHWSEIEILQIFRIVAQFIETFSCEFNNSMRNMSGENKSYHFIPVKKNTNNSSQMEGSIYSNFKDVDK